MMIAQNFYKQIISNIPILCVDVIVKNENKNYLLLSRKNEPLKNQWWVIGGRVFLGQTIEESCRRKVIEEANLKINDLKFVGYYEDCFDTNAFEKKIYHTISLVFETNISKVYVEKNIKLNADHTSWKWFNHLPKRLIIQN
jgi:colanic acid biosynthesis protein WcaH